MWKMNFSFCIMKSILRLKNSNNNISYPPESLANKTHKISKQKIPAKPSTKVGMMAWLTTLWSQPSAGCDMWQVITKEIGRTAIELQIPFIPLSHILGLALQEEITRGSLF